MTRRNTETMDGDLGLCAGGLLRAMVLWVVCVGGVAACSDSGDGGRRAAGWPDALDASLAGGGDGSEGARDDAAQRADPIDASDSDGRARRDDGGVSGAGTAVDGDVGSMDVRVDAADLDTRSSVDVGESSDGAAARGEDGGGPDEAMGNAAPGALEMGALVIETNPRMSLGCYVSWTTKEPADSEVHFGEDSFDLRIVDRSLVTKHKVYVIGMHPRTTYRLKAVSTNATATGAAEGQFTTGALPAGFPTGGTVLANVPAKMQRGWTLTNIEAEEEMGQSPYPPLIVIVDESATPVWYYVHGTAVDATGDVLTKWLAAERHVLVGPAKGTGPVEVDLEGNVIWTGPAQSGNPKMGHYAGKLSNGNYVILREGSIGALVQEVSPRNVVVWSWSLFDHIKPPQTKTEWCHPNAVTIDEAGGFLYLNCRFQGLFKAKRDGTGDILWQMGAGIDSMTTGDVTYLPTNDVRFIDGHDPELHDDGTILFYDNQGWAGRTVGEKNGSYHSRAVEYQMDQQNKQATLVWEFPGDFDVDSWYSDEWYTPAWGDADRLPNGNVLITAGDRGLGTQTRIFEVTRAGEVVWSMVWPENTLSYQAERISPPLAQPTERPER